MILLKVEADISFVGALSQMKRITVSEQPDQSAADIVQLYGYRKTLVIEVTVGCPIPIQLV